MDTLEKKYKILSRSLNALQKIIVLFNHYGPADIEYEPMRDSMVKRFELCCDVLWKYLKLYIEQKHGVIAASPKKVYLECVTIGIVTEQENKILLKMVDDRNETTHNYEEECAENLIQLIPGYYELMKSVAERTEE